jgi:hypothetical protein
MIIQPYTIVQGNYDVQLDFVVVDGQGNAVNLTGATLVLRVQSANDPTQTDLTLGGSMVIDSPTAGTCHYLVAQGDFPNPGTFLAQIDIEPSAGGVISVPGITILVVPGLPKSNN